ncbi:MAG: hypothetical protein D6762_07855 [Candidatus Neomarinimicrobiota bacterium]|nr:MAG: hypothetical protein D6762_07855 [Candidatus Neomarinimicrobiota bacterium]
MYFRIVDLSGSGVEDLALDVVGNLFRRNKDGRFVNFERYFLPIFSRIRNNPREAFVHLKRLVSSHLSQEFSRILRQEDPQGWKIYRNILMVPRRSEYVDMVEIQYRRYFLYRQSMEEDIWTFFEGEKPMIPLPQLEAWLREIITTVKTTPTIVENVLKSIATSGKYAPMVAVDDLHVTIQKILGLSFTFMDDLDQVEVEPELTLPKATLVDLIDQHIQMQLEKSYRLTGKVCDAITERYHGILMTYFEDLIWLGKTRPLTDYMNHTQENEILLENWDVHRHRLAYMIQKGKSHLKNIFLNL